MSAGQVRVRRLNEVAVSRDLVSALLSESTPGGRAAFDEVFPLVYADLRRLARRQLGNQWRQQTLNTTGLVHEAYLRLVDEAQVPSRGRAYFFGAAAMAMRQVLVDAARRRGRLKRGGGQDDLSLDEALVATEEFAEELVEMDQALSRLEEGFPRQARVVECRFFGGLSIDETAAALDMSRRSVVRDWTLARAFLFREMGKRSLV